jgi:hypothetical protein
LIATDFWNVTGVSVIEKLAVVAPSANAKVLGTGRAASEEASLTLNPAGAGMLTVTVQVTVPADPPTNVLGVI